MSGLKSMQRPIRNHVGAGVPKANASATTEDSVDGKKIETSSKAVPARGAPAPQAPRLPATSTAQSEPPMDVDPTELISTIPPAGQAPRANAAPVTIDDSDLEDDGATQMFKRPEPSGPPRRPPPPKGKAAAPPGKPSSNPRLPAPTRVDKPALASPKAPERVAASLPKGVVKPPAIKADDKAALGKAPSASAEKPLRAKAPAQKADDKPVLGKAGIKPEEKSPLVKPAIKPEEKPLLAKASANEFVAPEPKLSERPLFEVTIGSEKPLLATPDADEISLLAPKAPSVPRLGVTAAGDFGSFDLKPRDGLSPLPVLPMLDFSRDVSGMGRSSPPHGIAVRLVGFARTHAKWLMMSGATVAIAAAAWMVFHVASAGPEAAAAGASSSAHTVAASPTARPIAAEQPVPTAPAAQAVAADNPEPASPPAEPAPVEKNGLAEAVAAVGVNVAGSTVEQAESTAIAVRPGARAAAAPASEAPAAERGEQAPAVEPTARPAAARGNVSSPHTPESATELPAAKAVPEPVSAPAPAVPVAPPSVGGFDGTADFDQGAAMAALRQAAESAKRCQTPDAPSGGVRIAVTFARSGTVSATQVEGPVAGTPLGDCVVAKFQGVHVPPFRGSVMTVRKTVMF